VTINTPGDAFGELLHRFRKRAHLTQQQLAETIGMHRHAISRWEQGEFLPASKAIVLELARSLRLKDQEARQLLDASLTAPVPFWHVPFPRNPFFTGRQAVLQRLHSFLLEEQDLMTSRSYALSGWGGIGKTQTAIEYAYRHALDYAGVFWIHAAHLYHRSWLARARVSRLWLRLS
jgi:transcriptional regulator with XRE-family HTH domain